MSSHRKSSISDKVKSKSIPQFELPVAGDVFNLAFESTGDGERIAKALRQATAARTEADRLEAQQQGQLFYTNPEPQITNQT
jgi:hypothetical protein